MTTTIRVRVCFAVKLGVLIPYYEKDLIIIERVEVYIYIYIYTHYYKDKKVIV